ncbi:MAG: excinuclease ABC subunit UvrA [Alphaproteobacteria bacterium]|nr:excinuclease ABC subunit UvrA [Alphaproteobacteria bacterium]
MAKTNKSIEHTEWIRVRGAKTHNLKNINVDIPRNAMTVISGLSGSGKSSLAFDTIFAEGQRRYIESLSAYARQFLRQMQKPEIDEITGLSPAISIDQKSAGRNPRSTVATITEVYDYLRVLYARVGVPYCLECHTPIEKVPKDEILRRVEINLKERIPKTTKKVIKGVAVDSSFVRIFAPVVVGRKGEYYQMLYDFLHKGYDKVRIDGTMYPLRERITIDKNQKHTIELLVDTIFVSEYVKTPKVFRERLSDAVDRSLHEANGLITVSYPDATEQMLSSRFLCATCGFSFPEIEPRLFSFNSPYGACQACNGLGTVDDMFDAVCEVCVGARLRKEALSVFIPTKKEKKNIVELIGLTIDECLHFVEHIDLSSQEKEVAEPLLIEIRARLQFLINVGLEYLTVDRRANTLSGGEAQRIRLASQLGSGLVGALYVLDEPTIGLHQKDNDRLIKTLTHLRDLGNTIIVVEHDEDTMFACDYLVDIGPGAGVHGGEVVVQGYLEELVTAPTNKSKSSTLSYLRQEKKIAVPKKRRIHSTNALKIVGGNAHNVKDIDIDIPLGVMTVITGVSGSGKSSLMHEILYKNLERKLEKKMARASAINAKTFTGHEHISRVILVDQAPIGRTPRSTPATYIGAWGYIRDLFASTEQSRYKGWGADKFTFNRAGGRCEKCEGNGEIAVEMHFLPTVYVLCDQCQGKRFMKEILEVEYKKKSIHDVLSMSIEESHIFFKDIPAIEERLRSLSAVGLGYITLGQSATTLSGGEAQRIKIASELYRPHTQKTIYLLDEPTVGLHYDDVARLIAILHTLVERGNTVVLIEHSMDVIKCCDYIIDMGPEGGIRGGECIAKGTPETVAQIAKSYTGQYLKKVLK